jgi:hypothetical protein
MVTTKYCPGKQMENVIEEPITSTARSLEEMEQYEQQTYEVQYVDYSWRDKKTGEIHSSTDDPNWES